MAGEVFTTVQFGGDQPALDPKQITEPYVVDGENYLVDAEGPYSAFGNTIINYTRLEGSDFYYSFEVGDEFFLFTDEAVLRYNENALSYYPAYIYETADATQKWPWTHARVGGLDYFARKGYGLIQYNPITGRWKEVTGNGLAATADIYACLEVVGRCVVLSTDAYQWSDIDDGEMYTTDTSKGTGAQALNIIGGGTPYGLYRTADGFCVFTSKGSIKVEEIDAIALSFRHYVLSHDVQPLDQLNVIQFGKDTILMMTKNGLFTTTGRQPEVFEPLMSEYFSRDLFPKINLSTVGLIRLYYSDDKQLLFVSVAVNEVPFIYPMAHVLYRPVSKWGEFNRTHAAIGDFNLTKTPLTEDNLGYICQCSYVRALIEYPVNEVLLITQGDELVYFTNEIVYPSRWQSDKINFASYINVSGIDRNAYPLNPGMYTQATKAPRPPNIQPIDSWIRVGPYRVRAQDYAAYLNVLEQAAVGMLEEPPFVEDVDEMLLDGDVDEMTLTGDYDEGYDLFSGVNYAIKAIGTLDAFNTFDEQEEVLTLEYTEGRIKFYSGDVHGMYIMIEIRAEEQNQSFHLKFLENTVNLGGIL